MAAELDESGQTVLTRVSEMDEIQDLLEDYDTGSLTTGLSPWKFLGEESSMETKPM